MTKKVPLKAFVSVIERKTGKILKDNFQKEQITIGVARTGIARVCRLNADPPYDVDFIPIYMSCTECGLYLGDIESDYADILGEMCLKCFMEQTGVL